MSDSSINRRWYDPILMGIIPPMGALIIKILMLSCRVIKIEGQEREKEALSQSGGSAVYSTWHQRMSYLSHFFGQTRATVLVSQSRDGEYAARIAAWLGYKTVRGSSSRGGLKALKEMVAKIKGGEIGGILADGPQGPARKAKMGATIIAREAEVPLIPLVWSGDRCWQFNSWDRYLVPKPFAKLVIHYGEPVWIPKAVKGKELDEYRKQLEERLNLGARWCDEQFGPEKPWRKVTEPGTPEIGPI